MYDTVLVRPLLGPCLVQKFSIKNLLLVPLGQLSPSLNLKAGEYRLL